jgi:predicted AAA+ superfamily ATPase
MRTNQQLFRWLSTRMPPTTDRRLLVLTGARQTGKTTLARASYPDLAYINLDAIEEREALRTVRSAAFGRVVGNAVLDEVQKEPALLDKVKYAYDAEQMRFGVLLGSSRLHLLRSVRETLAGRAFLTDLWPLMTSELVAGASSPPAMPLLDRLLTDPRPVGAIVAEEAPLLVGDAEENRLSAIEHLLEWGGLPALLPLDDTERRDWLRSYLQTYVERDLTDVARLPELGPFRTLERLVMARSGQLLSYSSLASDGQLSATTARRYLDYLGVTYQVVVLPPFSRNLTSQVVHTPKVYWVDAGTLRTGTRQFGEASGELFESLLVSEAAKWTSTMGRDAALSFYRTRSGLEVDLMVQTPAGVMGLEVKNRQRVSVRDASALLAVAGALGAEWRGGLVVYRGRVIEPLVPEADVWAMPAHRLLT